MDFRYRLYIDGLPSAVIIRDPETGKVHKDYFDGIPVGKMVKGDQDGVFNYVLYNHWVITTRVQPLEGSSKSFRIVGFEVEPRSYGKGEEVTGEY